MANANISPIQLTNTFDEWRVATNDLVQDRNTLRNASYVKDESDFTIANGAMVISRSTGGTLLTITGTGSALVGGTTTTTDLIVGDDAAVANQLSVTGNTIIGGTLNVNAKIYAHNANGDLVLTTGNVFIGANATVNANLTVNKNTAISQNLALTGDFVVNTNSFLVYSTTGNTVIRGDLTISGGDVVANTASLNLINDIVETLDFAGFAKTINVGSTTSNTVFRGNVNVTSNLSVDSSTLFVDSVNKRVGIGTLTPAVRLDVRTAAGTPVQTNLYTGSNAANATLSLGQVGTVAWDQTILSTSGHWYLGINGGEAAYSINRSGLAVDYHAWLTAGSERVRIINTGNVGIGTVNPTVPLHVIGDSIISGDLTVSGGDIVTSTAIANVANTSVTEINFGGSAATVRLGSASGTTTVRNNLTVTNDLTVSGGDIVSTAIANLLNTTTTTLNLGGAATTLNMGSSAGSVTIAGDLVVSGGDITSTATANVVNTSATLINFGGAAANVLVGSATGTVNLRNRLYMTDNVYIPQGKNLFAYFIQTSSTENFYIERGNGVFKNVEIQGTFSLSSPAILTANSIIINEMPSAARNAQFIVRRGSTSSNAFIQWNESAAVWRAANSDSGISTLLTVANVVNSVTSTSVIDAAAPAAVKTTYDTTIAAYNQANNAYNAANNVGSTTAGPAYAQANAAYNQANNAYTAANNRVSSVSGTSGRITSSGGLTPALDLATAGPGAGSYGGGVGSITLDAYGRVTALSSGGIPSGNVVQNITVGGSTTLSAGQSHYVTSASQTITLPASPGSGVDVRITVGNFINTVVARNGQNIMGVAENLTVDIPYSTLHLIYSGATQGWVFFNKL